MRIHKSQVWRTIFPPMIPFVKRLIHPITGGGGNLHLERHAVSVRDVLKEPKNFTIYARVCFLFFNSF